MRVATCEGRPNVEAWKKFEGALLLRFRERFGAVPMLNSMGKKAREKEHFRFFTRKALDKILNAMKDGVE